MSFHDDSVPSWLGQEGHEESTQQWLEDQTFRFANSSPAPDPSTASSMQQLCNPPPKADPTLKTEQGQHQNTNFDNPLYSLPFYNDEVRQAREPSPDTPRLDEELRAEQDRYNSWRRIWRDRLDPGELPVWFGKDEFALWSEWWMEDENSAAADTDSPISLDLDDKESTESQKRKRESNQTTGRLRSPPPPQPEKTEEELLEEYVEDLEQITKTMLTALSVYTDHLAATGVPMEEEALKYLKFIVCLEKGKFVPSDDYNSHNRLPKPKLEEPNLCVELLIQELREYWWRVQNWFNGDFDREAWEAIKVLIQRGEGDGDEGDE